MAHASESGHWYAFDGTPVYEVPAANGKMRPTTLRDARKLNLFPSVTGIIRCAAAPGLERWKQEQTLLAALTLPRGQDEPESDWLERVRSDSQEQARKAAERGTAIHAAIQGHYEGKTCPAEYWPHVKGAVEAVRGWLDTEWTPEKSFAHPWGYGGKTDLSCPLAIVDFKSKEFGPEDDLETYDEQHMQLAAYREGVEYKTAQGAICYVSTTVPGVAKVISVDTAKMEQGRDMFLALLAFWQAKNRYRPEWK